MMLDQKYIFAVICSYLCFTLHAISADEECDKSKCPGPLNYYEELRCTPIYSAENDCCAVRYNCDHLKERSADKCYVNDHVYNIGEKLEDEDARPCDIGCTCSSGYDGCTATFNCATVDCFSGPVKPGCYRKRSPAYCCPGAEVCPENDQERARCVVDGKTYLDGEAFAPNSDPDLNCYCQPGYKGKNVEPFCKSPTSAACGTELLHAPDIYNNCTPVYYSNQNPATSCSVFSRCQNNNDTVVRNDDGTGAETTDPDFTCVFGRLTMNLGDELNSATDYNSVCVKCVCEVPPLPTCQRLPDEECDVTVHPPFDNFSK